MKSKRAAKEAASAVSEGEKPIADATLDEQSVKKRKRSDEDGETNGSVKKSKKDKKDKSKEKEKDKKKKNKKDSKSETRKEKKEKRKDLQNLPEGLEGAEDEKADEPEVVEEEEKKEKKKSKEDKVNGAEDKESKKKKDKKDKKEKKEKKEDNQKPQNTPSDEKTTNGANGTDAIDLDASSARKPGRNIVFVGNLPYSATAASIIAHFASLKPIAVRCLTNKVSAADTKTTTTTTNTCKGIAFVEFGSSQQQRTCLDKFHHSTFEDGISPARKINVELTAGGGGKNQNRQDKIRQKNQKLDENRQKRIDNEKQEKLENGGAKQQQQTRMEDNIHPSRLARLPNLGQ